MLGSVVYVFIRNPHVWANFFLLGFYLALFLRLLVFSTASSASFGRAFLSSLLQPLLCVASLCLLSPIIEYISIYRFMLFLAMSVLTAVVAIFFFTSFANSVGKQTSGVPSLHLFKAFMANWVANLNEPLESILETFGEEKSVKFSVLSFQSGGKAKAMVVVPAFHAGPFNNVGSSLFPSMIQSLLEKELDCIVSVPHGLCQHELDLASQSQTRKVMESIRSSIGFSTPELVATPFIRVNGGGASASCQIFGNRMLVTLTTAPKSMEDLPPELSLFIAGEARKHGLLELTVVDSHNSIEGDFNLEGVIEPLKRVATESIEEAVRHKRRSFEIGAAKVVPKEFSLKEGMGPGGITVIATKVGDQKAAYVTIDGNNMVSGLREKILSSLREMGISEGEVLTTDTHAVVGVVMTKLGYNPIGEALDHARLINYVKQAATTALGNLEPAEVTWHTGTVSNVKVIGWKQIETLSVLAERTTQKAKRLALYIFPSFTAFFIVMLALL